MIDDPVKKDGIDVIHWIMNFKVASIKTEGGQTFYPTPAPAAWQWLFVVFLPIFGFFIPWGAVRARLKEAKIHEYTWHCNRHTFASRLVIAGVDLRTVAELLGHRTLHMVMRYAHLAPEHQASAVDRLVAGEGRIVTKSATGKSGAKAPKHTQTEKHR